MREQIDFDGKVMIAEGAMGTMLLAQGLDLGDNAALLNLSNPDAIERVHELYREAGATCATTNSFSPCTSDDPAVRQKAWEAVADSVRIARAANPGMVLGDMGPSGLVLEPVGNATFEQAESAYRDHVAALLEGGPDAILMETFIDVGDMRAAMIAVRELTDLPLIVSCTFNPEYRMPISSTSPEAAVAIAEALGADVIGENCWFGPEESIGVIERMSAATSLPLISQPNAGMPQTDSDGNTFYPGTVEQMVEYLPRFVESGVAIMGTCCGTTPEFTKGLSEAIPDIPLPDRKPGAHGLRLASSHEVLEPVDGRFDCSEAVIYDCLDGDFDKWDILENVGSCPFVISCGNDGTRMAEAISSSRLEQALKIYPGRAVLVLPALGGQSVVDATALAMKYGAALMIVDGDTGRSAETMDSLREIGIGKDSICTCENSSFSAEMDPTQLVIQTI